MTSTESREQELLSLTLGLAANEPRFTLSDGCGALASSAEPASAVLAVAAPVAWSPYEVWFTRVRSERVD